MASPSRFTDNLLEIPPGIWALGFVSLLMDVSSEMVHALLPIYLVSVMGASLTTIGVIEGVAEATASITKIFSGPLSDWLGQRKTVAVMGYGLAALSKPIFPIASSIGWLISARFLDRIGKGIRGAPRDALVAEISPAHLRGASVGLRQSLDTVGAFVGLLLSVGLMWLTGNRFHTVFWIAVIPAFLAVAVLMLAVQEPDRPPNLRSIGFPLSSKEIGRLSMDFWLLVAVATVFSLARFSEAFLILRARSVGLPIVLAPMLLVVMNIVYAVSAYPAGALSDRQNRLTVLAVGNAFLIAGDLAMALLDNLTGVALGVICWGLHLGFTQGSLIALVADTAPPELRGTAYGLFNLFGGLALLSASLFAGALWQDFGPRSTFLAGAFFASLALLGLIAIRRRVPALGNPIEKE